MPLCEAEPVDFQNPLYDKHTMVQGNSRTPNKTLDNEGSLGGSEEALLVNDQHLIAL